MTSAITMPVLNLKRRATLTAAHADLPGRLRRQSTREEMAIPARTSVLARIVAAPRAAAAQREQVEGEQSVSTRMEWPAPPSPVNPVNVEALTSQVIQQIDRRLLAYRERMGRV